MEPRWVPQGELADLLAGSLYWSGTALADPGRTLARGAGWYAALYGLGLETLPFAVVFDLGNLLLLGPAFPLSASEWLDRYPPEEQKVRVHYGNGFLAGLADRSWFQRAHDLVAGHRDPDPAVVFVIELLVRGLVDQETSPLVVQPARFQQVPWDRMAAEVREKGAIPVYREARDRIEAWMERPGGLRMDLEAFLDRASMRAGIEALGEPELFELEHLSVLDTRERRLSARHLKAAEGLLPVSTSAGSQRPAEAEEVEVEVPDEGTYPSGGLDGLANRGSWENLVASELMYLDRSAEVDLFTVRFVEGELLFYTRDAGQLRRRKRALHLVVDLGPRSVVKLPEHPYRQDVMVEAMGVRLVADLLEAFEKDAVTVTVHLSGSEVGIRRERWRLRFQTEIRRGEVQVEEGAPGLAGDSSPETWGSPARRTYAVWIGEDPPLDPARRQRLENEQVLGFAVRLGAPSRPGDPDWSLGLELGEGFGEALAEVRERLLGAILGLA